MDDFVRVMVSIIAVLVLLFGYAILHTLVRMERRMQVQGNAIAHIQRSTSTTQSQLRSRLKSNEVQPIMDKPKAEQHYEGRGIKRVARGGKEDPASGESTPARIGSVKRRSYGGTSSNSAGS